MKLTVAWEKIITENLFLKIAVGTLFLTTISLTIFVGTLVFEDPIIIERGCLSSTPTLGAEKQTTLEYENFLKTALNQRFSTETEIVEGYLSIDEKRNKEKEQKNLEKNQLKQFIYVRKVFFKDSDIFVEADRIYSIKKVRSALPIKLKVTLETKSRTDTNPYGLILIKTEEIKSKKVVNND